LNFTVNWNANGYRLPTEMEWLWATMGAANGQSGTNTSGSRYFYAGYPAVTSRDEAAWYFQNSGYAYKSKGTRKPNPLGLFDMSGNIAEWCWDWYDGGTNYEYIPGGRDYTGLATGSWKMLRDGNYMSADWVLKFSFRGDSIVTPNEYPYRGPKEAGLRILCRD
jgi:formylglycine-generating enzyme required for sulfatase activity